MTTFQSVNVGLGPHDHQHEVTTPTTPRAPIILPSQSQSISTVDEQSTATPTRLNFGGISGQRPLPTSPFRSSFTAQTQVNEISAAPGALKREQSHRSVQSTGSQDVDMDESDEEGGSDEESIDAETGRPSKKKKGQKFFCTEFPPCNLSFTRSEHLARHIRYGLCLDQSREPLLMCLGNIPENDHSNATVLEDFHASTIFANMRKQCM